MVIGNISQAVIQSYKLLMICDCYFDSCDILRDMFVTMRIIMIVFHDCVRIIFGAIFLLYSTFLIYVIDQIVFTFLLVTAMHMAVRYRAIIQKSWRYVAANLCGDLIRVMCPLYLLVNIMMTVHCNVCH